MNCNFHQFQEQVLQMLLRGDDPTLVTLRSQLQLARRNRTEISGTGFFTYFDVPLEAPRLPNNACMRFGDVTAELEGLRYGTGFVVFVDGGLLTMLEGYTYNETWPPVIGSFKLSFMGKPCRDWDSLRKTPGWP